MRLSAKTKKCTKDKKAGKFFFESKWCQRSEKCLIENNFKKTKMGSIKKLLRAVHKKTN